MTATRRLGLVLFVLLALVAAACGDGEIGSGAAVAGGAAGDGPRTTEAAESSLEAADCPGEPLRFTTIAALTGPVSRGGERYRTGTDAAVASVNRECSLGRPIEVAFCDDAGDVNTNLACGRQAADDGSLALLTTIGSFDDGATASGLPGIFLYGTSAFELTDPNSYSSISGISVGMAGITAAKAAGADTFLLVLPDSPALQFVAVQVEQVAELIDIDLETIYFPTDTTDYAPIAAQISQRDPDAVGLLPSSPVAMINALADEGITPESHVMSIASIVLSPEIVHELGSTLNGMIVVSPTVPPNAVDNPGIAEFREDLEAIGKDPDDPTIDFTAVTAWSNIKKLEGALLAAGGPGYVANLTPQKLVRAIVEHPVDRPEAAPYDFRENQLTELPGLAGFRVFTREVVILQLQDEEYQLLADGFVDILDPPELG
jgi:ABC-type branched-subunit amino acid transport system substrate-binding protein